MIILIIAILIICGLVILLVANRKKRESKMDDEKLKLVAEGKKELAIFINLKRFLPIAIAVIFIILNIVLMSQPKIDSNEITSLKEVGGNNHFIVKIIDSIKYAMAIYTVLYLMLIFRIKKINTFNEEKRTAMLEYYGGRTLYLILICVMLFILSFGFSIILAPTAVNVI
ncbi:MAG: hypothetical protein IJX34_05020 [Clostridia bacterium]|nr:hypothetical protein [Clostridia bacterium]